VVECLDAIQILIPYFFNYISELQFLSISVVLYKVWCVVFFDATISLPVHCNAYRSIEQSAATLKHEKTDRTTEQQNLESQDNSDSRVMATGWTIQDWQGQGILSSPKHPASYSLGNGFLRGRNQWEREFNHASSSSADIKNEQRCTSAPPM
jgi:hypothetical protein